MTNTKLSHPHDRFMKELLSHSEIAGVLLRGRLLKAVAECLSAKPPKLIAGSFVDEALRGHLSDRLFEVETINSKTAFLICILIEALRRTPEDLRPIVHYLIQVYCYDEQTLRHLIHEVRPKEEATMMSQFAQDIRQKALQEGIQQACSKAGSRAYNKAGSWAGSRVYNKAWNGAWSKACNKASGKAG